MFKRKKGFTLIELIAVLVIMAILALIVTPLVMSIIRKAKISADKRSIDAYGRSIELAIAGYLLDNGDFPTSIDQLTIEYSGDEVVCSTTQLNNGSSVYLAGCTVAGRSVDYSYGKNDSSSSKTYSIGDEITYNNVDYYVIKNSSASDANVTLLKAEPLKYTEIYNIALNLNISVTEDGDYGKIQYGETSDYQTSYVKSILDNWIANDNNITEVRLITLDEIIDNFGYELAYVNPTTNLYSPSESTPAWVYNNGYNYFTSTPDSISSATVNPVSSVLEINDTYFHGAVDGRQVNDTSLIRPVITISKSAL